MADFDKAVAWTLTKEGVFSNDAHDRGGKTKFGITEADLHIFQQAGNLPDRRIEDLTKAEAIQIYRTFYWRYDALPQRIATKLFDIGVNMGLTAAATIAQRAVNFLGGAIIVDGLWGPQTIAAINRVSTQSLYSALTLFQAQRYVQIVLADRSQLDFINGWIARAGAQP